MPRVTAAGALVCILAFAYGCGSALPTSPSDVPAASVEGAAPVSSGDEASPAAADTDLAPSAHTALTQAQAIEIAERIAVTELSSAAAVIQSTSTVADVSHTRTHGGVQRAYNWRNEVDVPCPRGGRILSEPVIVALLDASGNGTGNMFDSLRYNACSFDSLGGVVTISDGRGSVRAELTFARNQITSARLTFSGTLDWRTGGGESGSCRYNLATTSSGLRVPVQLLSGTVCHPLPNGLSLANGFSVAAGRVPGGCQPSITPSSESVAAAGDGSLAAFVSTSPSVGCAWVASVDQSWLRLTDVVSNGFLRYAVEPNISTSSRTATVSVASMGASRQLVVAQDAGAGSGILTGTISSALNRRPIAGAVVVLGGTSGITDANGVYRIDNAPAGIQTVRTGASGFQDRTDSVNIAAGTTATTFSTTLAPVTGVLTGTITNAADGRPIAGATVALAGTSGTTNQSGVYRIENVPVGTHSVETSAPGFERRTDTVSINEDFPTTFSTALTPAQRTTVLTGTISNASNGQPISGARVAVGTLSATTNASGVYRIDNAAAGNQTVTISASGFTTRTDTVTIAAGATTTFSTALVPVAAGGNITIVLTWEAQPPDLDSHLRGPTTTGGRFHVYYSDPRPVSHASLDVDDTTGFGPETITVSPVGGQFVAGTYTYYVHNFSRTPGFDVSNARVTVFQSGVQLQQFTVSAASGSRASLWWSVFRFTLTATSSGQITITPIQQLGAAEPTAASSSLPAKR